MDNQTAIKVLKENIPKTCKMVDGRYKGGFDDWESDMGQAVLIAISALENQDKLRNEDLKENEMSKRTPENCSLIKRMGEPGTDANGKCMGFGREEADDEPCEPCKRCRFCTSADEDLTEI